MTKGRKPVRRAITALRLHNFRNYDTLSLKLDGRPVALYGDNGAGKTNVLEAISCLAQGRGLRRATAEDITRRTQTAAPTSPNAANTPPWAVSADVVVEGQAHRLGAGQDPKAPTRRIYRLDGDNATSSAIGAIARLVWLTPAQDRVFAGPRSDRMRFFDRLTLAMTPSHGSTATAYDRAVRERTKLLEDYRADPVWIDGVEAEMARHGVALASARASMAEQLQLVIDTRPESVFPKADLAVEGLLEARILRGEDLGLIEQDFRDALAAARGRDARAGRALEGPHRTDLAVTHRPKAMPAAHCSTGEQKALLVGMSLAHARAVADTTSGPAPMVLLDEAAAHLDIDRRITLADEICDLGVQAWLTGTDADLFQPFGRRAQFIELSAGSLAA